MAEVHETLEMIAGSYETRDERFLALWRAFIDHFAQSHGWKELFTFNEVECAYHAYLHALISC